jgi:RNA polymerase sigma-70 factor, ECF subfamily
MKGAAENEFRWVELAMAGDFDSFAALYSRHLETIYRYIYYRTGDSHDAEDLTEQVFLKAWEAMSRYKPVGSCFCSWLYRISHNIVVDHHRRKKRVSYEELEGDNLPPDGAEWSLLDTMISAEESATLAAAIVRLPEDQQQVLLLRFIEGLGHAEIAQILNKSEVACRGIQYRALTALHRILTDQTGRIQSRTWAGPR